MQPGISPSFAVWISQKHRFPYTAWGDFLRVTQKSGELESIVTYPDLTQLVAKYRFDHSVSEANLAWRDYCRWLGKNGHSDPNGRG